MHYAVLSLQLPPDQADLLAEVLIGQGFTSFAHSVRDDGVAEVEIYGADGQLPDAVARAFAACGVALPTARVADDATLLKDYLPDQPSEVAPGLWVHPLRDGAPVSDNSQLETRNPKLVIAMPPVPAFGDGQHPTTRLVAQLLMDAPPQGARVLDLGSGTGLLAIAAWRLGAALVDASDLDADAVAASRAVAAANGCPLRVFQSDLLDALPADAVYDIVLANLYGELQEALAAHPRLDAVLPRGRVLLSGISRGKESAVRAAWERRGFRITDTRADGFWCALALTRCINAPA